MRTTLFVYRSKCPPLFTTPVGTLPNNHHDDTKCTCWTSLHFAPRAMNWPAETYLLFLSTADLHLTVCLNVVVHAQGIHTNVAFMCILQVGQLIQTQELNATIIVFYNAINTLYIPLLATLLYLMMQRYQVLHLLILRFIWLFGLQHYRNVTVEPIDLWKSLDQRTNVFKATCIYKLKFDIQCTLSVLTLMSCYGSLYLRSLIFLIIETRLVSRLLMLNHIPTCHCLTTWRWLYIIQRQNPFKQASSCLHIPVVYRGINSIISVFNFPFPCSPPHLWVQSKSCGPTRSSVLFCFLFICWLKQYNTRVDPSLWLVEMLKEIQKKIRFWILLISVICVRRSILIKIRDCVSPFCIVTWPQAVVWHISSTSICLALLWTIILPFPL